MTSLRPTAAPAVLTVGQAIEATLVDDLAEVQLFDGPNAQQGYAERSITIGGRWAPDYGEAGAYTADETVLVERAERGGSRRVTETTSIVCMAYAGSGEQALDTHRAAVGVLLTAVARAVRDITDVDGANASARLAGQQWAQVLDGQGGGVMCQFTVVVAVLP